MIDTWYRFGPDNIRRIVLSCAIAVVVASGIAQAAAPEVTVGVDRRQGTVGDPINLTLRVRYDSALSAIPIYIDKKLGEFDVLQDSLISEDRLENGRKVYEHHWRLAAFQPDSLWVPPLSGELVDTTGARSVWVSDSIPIVISSVLPAQTDSLDIAGLKGPYVAPEPLSAWWYVLAGVVVIGLLAAWWIRRRRHPPVRPEPPPIPPWEDAVTALQRMQSEIDPATDGGRTWYFRLSEILRRYLDGRYGWNTIDQTSTEIARQLKTAPFDGPHRAKATEFLQIADLVRYARTPAQTGRPHTDWGWVRDFVEATKPRTLISDQESEEVTSDGPTDDGGGA